MSGADADRPRDAAVEVWAPGFSSAGGGIAAFSRELAIALAQSGTRVELASKQDRDGTVAGLRHRGSGRLPPPWRTAGFAARLLWGGLRRPPRCVVTTHPNVAPVAHLLRALRRTPYAVVGHGIDVHDRLTPPRRRALVEAEAVWVASRWTRTRCIDVGVAPDAIRVLGNTVDETRFHTGPRDAELAARYGIAVGEKVVLTVARLDPAERYKGYDRIVRELPRVCEAVGPVRYLLVGAGGDRARVERLAAECGVADRVTFCGFVPDQALPAHYRLADAFAMPSQAEGFGIVYLEAMASGVPVLGGDRDGTPDALRDGELGRLVDPTDDAAIADALIALLQRRGPAAWFDPEALRRACIAHHGREAFAARVATLLAAMPSGAN